MAEMIPRKAHFIWFGSTFPWVYGMALRSAALRGGFEQVLLHHEQPLEPTAGWKVALDTEGVEARPLEAEQLWRDIGGSLGPKLQALYRRLEQPAARANMVRAGLLALEGGVYLDTDTVTLKSFEPLLSTGVFCGVERIVLPAWVHRSRNPLVWAGVGVRMATRDLCRRLPGGWRIFRSVERHYSEAVNNAILGAEPGHPFVEQMLERMVNTPEERQLVRYELGTTLLQDQVAAYEGADLVVHPPQTFYPLCPEISEHWFREGSLPLVTELLSDATVCVHWYASVRTKRIVPQIDSDYVQRRASSQALSALLDPLLK